MPGWLTVNYVPERLLFASLIIGCLFIVGGQLMSLIAVLYLRRSFAIFIQLRDVVMKGPYRYVRHPMYTGYTLVAIGLLFSNLCAVYVLISAMHIGLLAYRAHLEETMLAANDPGYRKNMECAGFLFPRFSLLLKGLPSS
jgi:protein-S-isoprenylcysteine O-methyltransferase Ste14